VAEARSQEFLKGPALSRIWDATCGIGADSIALVSARLPVIASDRDPWTLRVARANLAGRAACVLADATRPPLAPGAADGLLIDPDRRLGGHREGDPERWGPPLSACLSLAMAFGRACIKLPPGLDPEVLPPGGLRRWTSLGGELRELALWPQDEPGREAVALDGRGGRFVLRGEPEHVPALTPEAARSIPWLAEPDPAVIRAGLVGTLASREGLAPLAPQLAYLGGEQRPSSPLLRAWPVLDTCTLDRRRVRAMLAAHDVGPLTVKKRGHPDSAQVLARRLAGKGSQPGLLAVARLERGHLALLLGPVSAPDGQQLGAGGGR
jgi:THUMP domain-like